MILLGSTLKNIPIMGIQTGNQLALTGDPIIDPAKLVVVAYELTGNLLNSHPLLLTVADIREMSDIGIIVDSSDEFVAPEDIIKINDIYNFHFSLVGMSVTNERRQKLGKVIDFTIDTGGFVIQQLTVKRPFLQSFNDTELLIHRSQIIEINDDSIVVHSEAKAPEPELHEVVGSYINPFRKQKTAGPDSTEADTHD